MTGEVDLVGVFLPALLVAALGAGVVLVALRRVLAWAGFYRLVWHRTLVDVAIYVILLGGTVLLLARRADDASAQAPRSGVVPAVSPPVGPAPTARIS